MSVISYRSGQNLKSMVDNKMKYPKRSIKDILYSALWLDNGIFNSSKNRFVLIQNRQEVWNTVENSETRINARYAREIMVALPAELNLNQMIKLSTSFVYLLRKRYDTIFDMNLHKPKSDNRNYHCHIVFATRRYEGGFFYEKLSSLDVKNNNELKWIRKLWEELANTALKDIRSNERISCSKTKSEVKRIHYPMSTWKAYQNLDIDIPREAFIKKYRNIENSMNECIAKEKQILDQLFGIWYAEQFLKNDEELNENYYNKGERVFKEYGNKNLGNLIKQIGKLEQTNERIREGFVVCTKGISYSKSRANKIYEELLQEEEEYENRILQSSDNFKEEEERVETLLFGLSLSGNEIRKHRLQRGKIGNKDKKIKQSRNYIINFIKSKARKKNINKREKYGRI